MFLFSDSDSDRYSDIENDSKCNENLELEKKDNLLWCVVCGINSVVVDFRFFGNCGKGGIFLKVMLVYFVIVVNVF